MNTKIAESKKLLTELLQLSSRQLEQLDREAYDDMLALIDKKSSMLTELGKILASLRNERSALENRSSGARPTDVKSDYQEVNDMIRKFQILDKYLIQQIMVHRDSVGSRLYKLLTTKTMSDSYFQRSDQSKLLDRAV